MTNLPRRHGTLQAHASESETDPEWDHFLTHTPLGQFQQSSLWALIKQREGWRAIRILITEDQRTIGGFQLLYKHLPFVGRIGYVSKGPVIVIEDANAASYVLGTLRDIAARHRINALIVQPPDECKTFPALLDASPYSKNALVPVTHANLVIDVSQGLTQAEQHMRRGTLQEIRQARRRGVTIREGGAADASTFFSLMLESCRRQGNVKPNPPREDQVAHMWNILQAHGHIRLTFAEFEGEILAGLLCIPFGSRVSLWKKGWSSRLAEKRPNQLLYHEALEWACAHGYKSCDFAAMHPETARSIIQGEPLSRQAKRSRDFFNLGFGGTPVLLPDSRLYIPHRLVRMAYRAFGSKLLDMHTRRRMNSFT